MVINYLLNGMILLEFTTFLFAITIRGGQRCAEVGHGPVCGFHKWHKGPKNGGKTKAGKQVKTQKFLAVFRTWKNHRESTIFF